MALYPQYPLRRQNEDGFFTFNSKLKGMQKVLKQVVGVDVAQKELVVSLGRMYEDFALEIHAYKAF